MPLDVIQTAAQPAPATAPRVDLPASAQSGAAPSALLDAAKAQRSELRSQQDRLESKRGDLTRELADENTPAGAKPGIEARIRDVDARIAATDQQLAQADQAVATAASVPGAVVPDKPVQRNGPPDEIVAIPIVIVLFVFFPLALAYARRIWKKAGNVAAPVSEEVRDRLDRLTESVESIALEVERIGEGQRFITKVMSDGGRAVGAGAIGAGALGAGALGAGAAASIGVPQAVPQAVPVRREG